MEGKKIDVDFQQVSAFVVPVLLILVVGTTSLVYQCNKLRTILKNNKEREVHKVQNQVQEMRDLQGMLRVSSARTQTELAQEMQAVAKMQAEVTSQLKALKKVLHHLQTAQQSEPNISTKRPDMAPLKKEK